ncbi:MAG TPA: DNA polymerase III subunit epsilon [Rhizomicrobium sp.]|nr:DNA polymerase III subunit epsilon [Rhizomicrobium sp.]
MREIVLDTETTGLDPADGHRIVEIGCVELIDHLPTGAVFHRYLNPERLVPIESQRVHGLTDEFLADKAFFRDIAEELDAFLADSPLVIHNASFDIKFLNAELLRVMRPGISIARAIDTIDIAKAKIPGARYSLDELCKRFGIDLSARTKHGALLDAELTARVYLELVGGRQTRLQLAPRDAESTTVVEVVSTVVRLRPRPLPSRLTAAEEAAHAQFVAQELGPDALWNLKRAS